MNHREKPSYSSVSRLDCREWKLHFLTIWRGVFVCDHTIAERKLQFTVNWWCFYLSTVPSPNRASGVVFLFSKFQAAAVWKLLKAERLPQQQFPLCVRIRCCSTESSTGCVENVILHACKVWWILTVRMHRGVRCLTQTEKKFGCWYLWHRVRNGNEWETRHRQLFALLEINYQVIVISDSL